MKKFIILTCILAMLMTMTFVAAADEPTLILTDATASEGQPIYLTLKLNASVSGDTMGITYSYDADILEPMLSSCSWLKKGSLSNFNRENAGVWAAGKAQDLAGDICVLAFRVKSGASLKSTSVSCTLVVKNGEKEVGNYTAQANITYACNHNYGNWEGGQEIGHIKTCAYCSATLTELHSWNSGVPTENPDDPQHDFLVYTCNVCGDERKFEIPKIQEVPTNTPTHITQPTMDPMVTEKPEDPVLTVPPNPYEDPTVTVTIPDHTDPAPTEPPSPPDLTEPSVNITPIPGPTDFVPQETLPHDPEITTEPSAPTVATAPAATTLPQDEPSATEPQSTTQPLEEPTAVEPQDTTATTEPADPSPTEPPKPQEKETEPADTTEPKPTYPDNGSREEEEDEEILTEATHFPTIADTEPTTPFKDYNTPSEEKPAPTPVLPTQTEAPSEVCTDPAHEHDDVPEKAGNPLVTGAVVIGFLAIALICANLYLKKKRK